MCVVYDGFSQLKAKGGARHGTVWSVGRVSRCFEPSVRYSLVNNQIIDFFGVSCSKYYDDDMKDSRFVRQTPEDDVVRFRKLTIFEAIENEREMTNNER